MMRFSCSRSHRAMGAALMVSAMMALSLGGCATVSEALAETIVGTHRATLDGRQVVGTAADADGYATAELTIADKLDRICYDLNDLRNVGAVTSVEIRRGDLGSTGPLVLTVRPSGDAEYANCVNRSEWVEDAFGRNVSAYYIQVNTSTGAIRGQFQ